MINAATKITIYTGYKFSKGCVLGGISSRFFSKINTKSAVLQYGLLSIINYLANKVLNENSENNLMALSGAFIVSNMIVKRSYNRNFTYKDAFKIDSLIIASSIAIGIFTGLVTYYFQKDTTTCTAF